MSAETPERPPLPDTVRRDLRLFLVALALTAVLYLFSIPLAYGVLLSGPVAAALGVKVLIDTRRRPAMLMQRFVLAAGIAMALLSSLLGIGLIMFRDMVVELDSCLDRAVTQQARQACQDTYQQRYQEVLEELGVRVP